LVQSNEQEQGPIFDDLKVFNKEVTLTYLEKNQDRLTWTYDCGDDGCLTNVEADPNEHINLAGDPAYAIVKEELKGILKQLNKDVFQPDRGQPQLAACTTSLKTGGYLGPFVDADSWYSPVHLSIKDMAKNALLDKALEKINQPEFENRVASVAQLIIPAVRGVLINGPGGDKCLANQSKPHYATVLV